MVERYSASAAGLELDYSKHLLDDAALAALLELADEAQLGDRIAALLHGETLNNTEARPALHSLLRADKAMGQADKFESVVATRTRMQTIVERIHSHEHPAIRASTSPTS